MLTDIIKKNVFLPEVNYYFSVFIYDALYYGRDTIKWD